MAIPTKRYEIETGELDIPVISSNDIDGKSSINKTTTNRAPGEVGSKYDLKKFSGSLSLVNGAIGNDAELTKRMLKALTGDEDMSHMLSQYIRNELSGTIKKSYGLLHVGVPRSITGNRVFGRVPTTGCETDLNKLLDLLRRLGAGFSLTPDLDGALSALMAILMKLICAGVPNAFSKVAGIVPFGDVIVRAGAGMIIVAAKNAGADIVIDIAKSSVGPQVRQYTPNVASLAVESLKGTDVTKVKDIDAFVTDFIEALEILDPGWKNTDTVLSILGLKHDGITLSDVIRKKLILKKGAFSNTGIVATDSDVTLCCGLRGVPNKRPPGSPQSVFGTNVKNNIPTTLDVREVLLNKYTQGCTV